MPATLGRETARHFGTRRVTPVVRRPPVQGEAPQREMHVKRILLVMAYMLWLPGCGDRSVAPAAASTRYLDYSERTDLLSGGVRMIPIHTTKGEFRVWTKRVGNSPGMKVLLLHGGPAATHEYFEAFDSYFPAGGIEYYYYDQLGSAYSDQPNEPELWDLSRFVDEVEQVRQALSLDRDNFYLLGHSWGGLLAIEYALKYQQHLKGLIVSNMMASIPAYNDYARTVLMPAMDDTTLGEIKRLEANGQTEEPRYMELLMPHYEQHVLRMPAAEWPDPAHMEMMAGKVQRGRYLFCPNGSHMAMYDDQKTYVDGVIHFVQDVDAGRF
jgi:proline iminopeptidase